jgi:hypothetical protein
LEGEISNLDCMGEIARNLITNCAAREDSLHQLGMTTFAVSQLAKMMRDFKNDYYKRWHRELEGVS